MTEKQRQKYSKFAIDQILFHEKELKRWKNISRGLSNTNGDFKKGDIELIDTLLVKVQDHSTVKVSDGKIVEKLKKDH